MIQGAINQALGIGAALKKANDLSKKEKSDKFTSFEKQLNEGGINAIISQGYSQELIGKSIQFQGASAAVNAQQQQYNDLVSQKAQRLSAGKSTKRLDAQIMKSQQAVMEAGQVRFKQREVLRETFERMKGGK